VEKERQCPRGQRMKCKAVQNTRGRLRRVCVPRLARKAAESLRSAAGAVAEEYRGRAEEVWQDASQRVRGFQEDAEQYVRDNPTKAIFTALGIGFVLGLIFRR